MGELVHGVGKMGDQNLNGLVKYLLLSSCLPAFPAVKYNCTENNFVVYAVGAKEVYPHKYPFVGRMITKTSFKTKSICGVSIIDDHWVLTAAHCCDNFPRKPNIKATSRNLTTVGIQIGAHYDPTCDQNYCDDSELDESQQCWKIITFPKLLFMKGTSKREQQLLQMMFA